MVDSHPSHRDLERFVLGDLDPRQSRCVLTHLVRGCDRCQEVTAELWKIGSGEPVSGRLSRRFEQAEAVDRVLVRVRRAHGELEAERAGGRLLLAELESGSPEQRVAQIQGRIQARIQEDPRFHTRGFCDVLLQESQERRSREPRQAEELARLAVEASLRIAPAESQPRPLLEDLTSRAWGAVADARCIAADFQGAEEALRQAESHRVLGTGEPLEKARLLDVEAALRGAQGRSHEAARLLRRTIAIYRRAGQPELVERALVLERCLRSGRGLASLLDLAALLAAEKASRMWSATRALARGISRAAGR